VDVNVRYEGMLPEEILDDIRKALDIKDTESEELFKATEALVLQNPTLKIFRDLTVFHYINHPQVSLIKRVDFLPPSAIFFSEKIKFLCRLIYRHADGNIGPCGGIKKNYLACSPHSPSEFEIKRAFSLGNIFCFLQADGLTDKKQQKSLNEILILIEDYYKMNDVKVVMSFAAGPCRSCDKCAGELGEVCYSPEKRRFSLEACGIDVDWAMKMMVLKTNDLSWEIEWIEDFGLNEIQNMSFKSVIGLLLSVS
jgi:hypothetical protein